METTSQSSPLQGIVSLHPPKQLRHWCKLAGLRPECSKRRDVHYYTGHGRRWRLNCHGEWQMSDRDFDRWANSVEASVLLPRSESAFLAAVAGMQANAAFSDRCAEDHQ